jgi:hypothetical protein
VLRLGPGTPPPRRRAPEREQAAALRRCYVPGASYVSDGASPVRRLLFRNATTSLLGAILDGPLRYRLSVPDAPLTRKPLQKRCDGL